jgi:hypothetical protein
MAATGNTGVFGGKKKKMRFMAHPARRKDPEDQMPTACWSRKRKRVKKQISEKNAEKRHHIHV